MHIPFANIFLTFSPFLTSPLTRNKNKKLALYHLLPLHVFSLGSGKAILKKQDQCNV